jgi:hypothetical protein
MMDRPEWIDDIDDRMDSWIEYADWLEAKVDRVQTLYSIGEVCRTGLEAECHRLEAEREQASQDYADLLKDYRALRKDVQPVVDESVQEGIYMVFTKEIFDNLKSALENDVETVTDDADMLALANLRSMIP